MDYRKIYDHLIERSRSREVLLEYLERHHVVPRCMGGNNNLSNLVDLTPEEHFLAHLLLVKIYNSNPKLVYAANMMKNMMKKRVKNNKQYGWLKKKFQEFQRAEKTGIPRTLESRTKQSRTFIEKYASGYITPSKGLTHSNKTRKVISEANKGKIIPIKSRSSLEGYILRYGEEGFGRFRADSKKKDSSSLEYYIRKYGEVDGPEKYKERNKKKAEDMRGSKNHSYGKHLTEDHRNKISKTRTGIKVLRSKEHNLKIGLANKGKKQPKSICVHCGKEASTPNIKRWHNDSCKFIR